MNTRWKCSLTVVKSRIDLTHRNVCFLRAKSYVEADVNSSAFLFDRGVGVQGRSECNVPILGNALLEGK